MVSDVHRPNSSACNNGLGVLHFRPVALPPASVNLARPVILHMHETTAKIKSAAQTIKAILELT
jgi:hypothetical protein